MAGENLSFASGVASGMGLGFGVKARIDNKRRREKQEKRADETADLRLENARFGLDRIKNKELRDQAIFKRTEQENRKKDAQAYALQAIEFEKIGDYASADKAAAKANELSGGEYASMAVGNNGRFVGVMEAVSTGNMSPDDPRAVEAAKDFARPMMKQTGRYKDYTFNGFEQLDDGRIAATMRNRKTGEIVPATAAQTSSMDDMIVAKPIPQFIKEGMLGAKLESDFNQRNSPRLINRYKALYIGAGGKLPKEESPYNKLNDTQLFNKNTGEITGEAPKPKGNYKYIEGKGVLDKNTGEFLRGSTTGGLDHAMLLSETPEVQNSAILRAVEKDLSRDELVSVKQKLDKADTYADKLAVKDAVERSRVIKDLAGDLKGGFIEGNDDMSKALIKTRNKLVAANIPPDVIDGISKEAVEGVGVLDQKALLKRIDQEVDTAVANKRRWGWYSKLGSEFLKDPIGMIIGTNRNVPTIKAYNKNNPVFGSKASEEKARERLRRALSSPVKKKSLGNIIKDNRQGSVIYSRKIKDKFAAIESNSNRHTHRKGSSYYGKYQFDKQAVRDVGGSWDKLLAEDKRTRGKPNAPTPYQDALLERSLKNRIPRMKKYGIPITEKTIYLAHQQGVKGLAELMQVANGKKGFSKSRRQNAKANGAKGSNDRELATSLINIFTRKYDEA